MISSSSVCVMNISFRLGQRLVSSSPSAPKPPSLLGLGSLAAAMAMAPRGWTAAPSSGSAGIIMSSVRHISYCWSDERVKMLYFYLQTIRALLQCFASILSMGWSIFSRKILVRVERGKRGIFQALLDNFISEGNDRGQRKKWGSLPCKLISGPMMIFSGHDI